MILERFKARMLLSMHHPHLEDMDGRMRGDLLEAAKRFGWIPEEDDDFHRLNEDVLLTRHEMDELNKKVTKISQSIKEEFPNLDEESVGVLTDVRILREDMEAEQGLGWKEAMERLLPEGELDRDMEWRRFLAKAREMVQLMYGKRFMEVKEIVEEMARAGIMAEYLIATETKERRRVGYH